MMPPMSSGSVPDDFEDRARQRFLEVGGDVDPRAMVAILSIVRLANRITADLENSVYRGYGVSYAGFRVLFTVWLYGPLEPKRIAVLGSVSRASISSALNTLERDGFVSRSRVSSDRRLVTVDLTAQGRRLMMKSVVEHNRRERQWAAALSRAEQEQLIELLHALLEHHPDDVKLGPPAKRKRSSARVRAKR
jgi:DNA-binding MarR family transcriptional regulator